MKNCLNHVSFSESCKRCVALNPAPPPVEPETYPVPVGEVMADLVQQAMRDEPPETLQE